MNRPGLLFFEDLFRIQASISVTGKSRAAIDFDDAFQEFLSVLRGVQGTDAKVIIVMTRNVPVTAKFTFVVISDLSIKTYSI